MAGKQPPKTFINSRLDFKIIHPGGASWWHLTLARYPDPLGYGKTPSRFSDPRVALPEEEQFGVFYLGASIRVCFLETILRDRRTARTGYLPIPQSELQEWNTVPVEVAEPLRLVDLTGDGPIRMGVPTDAVRASRHHLGQVWSLALWGHNSQPDGILFPSRLNMELDMALFDRAVPKIRHAKVVPLLHQYREMADILRRFELSIV